jgi:hypothetical protein
MNDSNFVLLGKFTPEEAQNIAGTWDSFRQDRPINDLVAIYVCPEEKAWRERQCSSDT